MKAHHLKFFSISSASVLIVCASLFMATVQAAESQSLVVDEKWLMAHINDTDLIIVDTRSQKKYKQNHIKGAVSLPASQTFSQFPPTDRLAPESEINILFGNAGIANNSMVVVYDGGQFKFAARLLWALHVNGHKKVAILSTDFSSWKSMQFPVSAEQTVLSKKRFVSRIQPDRMATAFQTLLATKNSSITIVDVRDLDEYRGETSRSRRYGHIPGAISIDWHDMAVIEDGVNRLKPTDDLRKLFSDINPDNSVITYCQKGHEAALAYIALSQMGHDVRLYDGSWHEWGNSTNLPVEGPDDSPAIPEAP